MKSVKILLSTLAFFVCNIVSVSAQDNLMKNNGETIKAKVVEITSSEVKYKKWDNIDGPMYVIPKSELSKIVYQNGTSDILTETTVTETPKTEKIQVVTPIQYTEPEQNNQSEYVYSPLVAVHNSSPTKLVYKGSNVAVTESDFSKLPGFDYQGFKKGLSSKRVGTGLTIGGAVAFGAGFGFSMACLANYFELWTDYEYDGNWYDEYGPAYERAARRDFYIACGFFAASMPMLAVGITKMVRGKKQMKNTVNSYNNSVSYSESKVSAPLELKFNASGTRASFALKF